MKIIIVVMFLIVSFVQNVRAEPNESASFLINDPVSLLDFGIYKLEKEIKGYSSTLRIQHKPPHSIFLDYDWDENKIVIGLSYGDDGNPSVKEIKREIKSVFAVLKRNFGVDSNGKVFQKEGVSNVPEYFSHKGYIKNNSPANFKKEIDKMIELKVIFYVQNYSRYFECKNMLVGNSVDELFCSDYLP